MVKNLGKEDNYFDLVANGSLIVDFYAEWCGPCQMLGRILEEIDYTDIIKVNTDKFPDLATKFGVMSIPTLLFYNNGLVMKKEVGYRTSEEIKKIFNEIRETK